MKTAIDFRSARSISYYVFVLIVLIFLSGCSLASRSPVPSDSRQLILVLNDSLEATSARLYRFTRTSRQQDWEQLDEGMNVSLARNGLAWGRGLHVLNQDMLPLKEEGDGRSPAGVFTLNSVFGYTAPDSVTGLKMPYIHNTEMLECIDDVESAYYNQLVYRDEIDEVTWQSSERMGFYGHWYAWGVTVDHNTGDVLPGCGSCIFLHNWAGPKGSTSGCTEMAEINMIEIAHWLDASKQPIIVQLSKPWYSELRSDWQLPELLNQLALDADLETQLRALKNKALETLEANVQQPTGDLYHQGIFPSTSVDYFNGFWAWDSWKHSAALAKYRPELAMDQINAMFDWQAADGMIPDVIYADSTENNWRNTKPPLAGWAAWSIYQQTGNKNFLRELYPKLKLYHSWWFLKRDINENGLCEYGSTDGSVIAAKRESGMDNAVRFDKSQVLNNNDDAWSLNQESVDLSAYLYSEKIYLSMMAKELGFQGESETFIKTSRNLAEASRTHFFNNDFFYDRYLTGEFVDVRGPEGWVPLWAEMATQQQADAAVRVIMSANHFNTFLPFPTLDRAHPDFPDRYWRGPVWLDQAYFAIIGMFNYGYEQEAKLLAIKLLTNLNGGDAEAPLFENYDPLTGKGLNAPDFSWTAAHILLIIDHFWPDIG